MKKKWGAVDDGLCFFFLIKDIRLFEKFKNILKYQNDLKSQKNFDFTDEVSRYLRKWCSKLIERFRRKSTFLSKMFPKESIFEGFGNKSPLILEIWGADGTNFWKVSSRQCHDLGGQILEKKENKTPGFHWDFFPLSKFFISARQQILLRKIFMHYFWK